MECVLSKLSKVLMMEIKDKDKKSFEQDLENILQLIEKVKQITSNSTESQNSNLLECSHTNRIHKYEMSPTQEDEINPVAFDAFLNKYNSLSNCINNQNLINDSVSISTINIENDFYSPDYETPIKDIEKLKEQESMETKNFFITDGVL
ncbi:hypothetical protein [Candidatus Nesciobacter abundans]|uniref:Uncharacterized protein n=1 Tax=Candidatus Nesciobacter abundans TaxID=2601668 RepID=A0A5C0UIE4_9PROT|nr:hypothetical protein [Candidatus Nesciobacter abundans]QEK39182.1 hypothetical protein FZC36_01925 [Candidatus Nesciobacter abundans]